MCDNGYQFGVMRSLEEFDSKVPESKFKDTVTEYIRNDKHGRNIEIYGRVNDDDTVSVLIEYAPHEVANGLNKSESTAMVIDSDLAATYFGKKELQLSHKYNKDVHTCLMSNTWMYKPRQ